MGKQICIFHVHMPNGGLLLNKGMSFGACYERDQSEWLSQNKPANENE